MSISLEQEAADVIGCVDGWYYCWHWKKNSGGSLTEDGVRKVIEDCEKYLASVPGRIHEINERALRVRALLSRARLSASPIRSKP